MDEDERGIRIPGILFHCFINKNKNNSPVDTLCVLNRNFELAMRKGVEQCFATISYSSRLAICVTVLELSVIFFGYAKMASLKALKAVLAYCFLLAILIILKTKFPQNFNTFKWFCTPAILFNFLSLGLRFSFSFT